jgi:Metallo-beta-lactamase superfamily
MEVYFVDIGRGTSNLILLGGRRAIVIDCGQNSGALLQLLEQFRVDTIAQLVISHNHRDHVGGALATLTQYEGRIEQIGFVHDDVLFASKFGRKIQKQIRDGTLRPAQLLRIESGPEPRYLYGTAGTSPTLRIFSPSFADNLQAIAEGDANATSGVLVLDCQGIRIVFAGDSTIRQWRRIREVKGSAVECDILSVPHHGGIVWDNVAELAWLYGEGVNPRHAVVSVATSNTDRHPRSEVIEAIIQSGCTVACTQITDRCCDSLETLRPGVLLPILPGRSRQTTNRTTSGRSRNLACAGTMVAEITNSRLTVHRIAEHRAAVDRLAASAGGHPLCR